MDAPRHLIHVGFPKAGATFFKAWCASRHDVAFVPGGVAGTLPVEGLPEDAALDPPPRLLVTSSETLTTGARFRTSHALRAREKAAYVSAAGVAEKQARVCDRLQLLFPTATVLILVRGYDSALRSMLSQQLKVFFTTRARLEEEVAQQLPQFARVMDYDFVVGLYERAFPGRVVVLPYELLRDDSAAFVRALCHAGGVPYRPFDPGVVNESPSPHALGLMFKASRVVNGAVWRLPDAAGFRARQALVRWTSRPRVARGLGRVGRALRVAPLPRRLASDEDLRALAAGRTAAVAQRPEVAPYAAHYGVGL